MNILITLINVSSVWGSYEMSSAKTVGSAFKGSYLDFILLGLIERTTLTKM